MIKTTTQTELADDLDNSIVGGTVATRSFSLGSDTRWIELSDENWNALVAALKPFYDVSRKAAKTAARKGRGPVQPSLVDAPSRAFNKAVREWAVANGKIEPTARGRISDKLKQEYRQWRNGTAEPAAELTRDQIPAF